MKRLHRYVLWELLQNACLTMVAVLAIFFMAALGFVLDKSESEGLPFRLVANATGFFAFGALNLTLPLTVLSSTILVFGRLRADREFTAMRVAGVHPWQVIVPALAFGAFGLLALCFLQGEIMPAARYRAQAELKQDVLSSLETLLHRSDRQLNHKRWVAQWSDLQQDADGFLVLKDLRLVMLDENREYKESFEAEWAKPHIDTHRNRLTVEMKEPKRQDLAGRTYSASDCTVVLDLDAFGGGSVRKRTSFLSYEELLTRAQRSRELVAKEDDPKARRKAGEKALEYEAAYYERISYALSALSFSFLGAAFGLWRGSHNRAMVFLQAFLMVLGLFYPLQMAGVWLAEKGILPGAVALLIGNVVLLVIGGYAFRRVTSP